MRSFGWLLLLALLPFSPAAAPAAEFSPEGRQLRKVLDGMDVSHHWIAGEHVNWQTGVPDGLPVSESGSHTHCSAFVAAAGQRLGVYILRPPEHKQIMLANAQATWLKTQGRSQGWRPVGTPQEAQRLANQGYLVVASYRHPAATKPGHIAIVRPSTKSLARLRAEGPDITQAGVTNYRRTSVQNGFRHHPGAWKNHDILYYAHPLPGGK